jgi:hypothetical protein
MTARLIYVAATAVQTTRETRGRKAGASRTCKRKASAQSAQPGSVLESESDSDQMEMDQAKAEEGDEDERPEPVTPEQSDDETDEENGSAPRGRSKSSETAGLGAAVAHGSTAEGAKSTGVPPPRVLPFSKKAMTTQGKGTTQQPSRAMANGEDDETEDEEL